MAESAGIPNVELVVVGDDVSVPRSRGKMVGRRCLAGITLVCKVLGAASEAGEDFQPLVSLGRSMAANIASVCMALEHCHVPGRAEFASIPEGRVEIGLGLHNETGVMNVAQPPADELVATMLRLCLDQEDGERAFVSFVPGDTLVLLVNNQGGLSPLELGAVVDEVLSQLDAQGITPARTLAGVFMGSMNMPGFSVSLLNVTNVARDTGRAEDALIALLDAPHTSAAWPATSTVHPLPGPLAGRKRGDAWAEAEVEAELAAPPEPEGAPGATLEGNARMIRAALERAGRAVVALEPQLTHWDTVVGDGDCGETCAAGANAVLAALDSGALASTDLVALFRELTELIDDAMGGTLGAIFSIFLAGLTNAIIRAAQQEPQPTVSTRWFGGVANEALETLQQRTAARLGHRTVMDALIPFAETLALSGDVGAAAQAARDGGEGTARLTAKLGRAAYVGDREDMDMPPDPGAMAFVAVAEAIASAAQAS